MSVTPRLSSRGSTFSGNPTHRYVHFNTEFVAEHRFCNNKISTALYQWWNVVPKLIWVEFSKAANFYFLIVSVLQTLPGITSTNGFPTTAPALLFVITIDIALKMYEDAERHRADRHANSSPCRRRVGGSIQPAIWIDTQVGDIIKICNHEQLPADVVLIAACEPDAAHPRGACHVETKGLDGETNLKGRVVPTALTSSLGGSLDCQLPAFNQVRGYVECETPNASTNKFSGTLHLEGQEPVPLTMNNVLLRGSSLRNTEYVLGLVVNTGVDTKVMQGAREPPMKNSSIDNNINAIMGCVCLLLLSLCFLAAGLCIWWEGAFGDDAWYLGIDSVGNFFIRALYFLVLLATFVSVSLYVSIMMCKWGQSYFMQQSLDMYDPNSDTPAKVRTHTLNDELGIVTHVFSDKTGTLTQNVMQFRKCSIAGLAYGKGNTEIGLARLKRLGQVSQDATLQSIDGSGSGNGGHFELVNFDGPELLHALDSGNAQCLQFFLHLALCHSVVSEIVDGEKKLSASSPDESALVAAAQHFGFEFVERHMEDVKLYDSRTKTELHYQLLEVLEFSSARRRMSVVVKDVKTQTLSLLTKGADSVMMKLLAPHQGGLVKTTEQHMVEHSNDGLRTLVIASKQLDEATYTAWSAEYRNAAASLDELEKKSRDEPNEIDRLCGEMETDLKLLGSTAIEDKLQLGVPQTIADIARGGVSLWVLTGDKEETAINIAFACQLLDTSTKIEVINERSHPTLQQLQGHLAECVAAINRDIAAGTEQQTKRALVIDGDALELVFGNRAGEKQSGCKLEFLQFTQYCSAVVACRCAPSQKAQLVTLVRDNVEGAVSLAIGDGANDVAMIQAAHVGVGISGQEGLQAANSADYAVAQFRFLRELMITQGRNNYRRMATLVCYMFYKNIMMVMTMYWYNFFNAWSGQKWNLEVGTQAYNLVWTSLPIIVIAVFDRDVTNETARKLPQLYHMGIRHYYWNRYVILRWFFEAMFESMLISLLCVFSLPSLGSSGEDPSVYYIGAHTLTIVIIVVNLKLFLWKYEQTWLTNTLIALSVLVWWPCCMIASLESVGASPGLTTYVTGWVGVWGNVLATTGFWLLLPVVSIAVLTPQFLYGVWLRQFYPQFRDLAREAETLGLDTTALECWEIPSEKRRLPLKKNAPVPPPPPTLFERLRASIAGQSARPKASGLVPPERQQCA